MPKLDRTSPVPLHFQLRQILLGKIQSGEWPAGALLPGEVDFQKMYDLSRNTVRQTLNSLMQEGHLIRQRGRGTFVAEPKGKLTHDPGNAGTLKTDLADRGYEAGWRLLHRGWLEDPPHQVLAGLGLEPGARVYTIDRLRLTGDEPIARHQAYLPEAVVERFDQDKLEQGESQDYLRGLPELEHAILNRNIESMLADSDDEEMLGLAIGSPILRITRTTMVEPNVLEFLVARYRGDRFQYRFSLPMR